MLSTAPSRRLLTIICVSACLGCSRDSDAPVLYTAGGGREGTAPDYAQFGGIEFGRAPPSNAELGPSGTFEMVGRVHGMDGVLFIQACGGGIQHIHFVQRWSSDPSRPEPAPVVVHSEDPVRSMESSFAGHRGALLSAGWSGMGRLKEEGRRHSELFWHESEGPATDSVLRAPGKTRYLSSDCETVGLLQVTRCTVSLTASSRVPCSE